MNKNIFFSLFCLVTVVIMTPFGAKAQAVFGVKAGPDFSSITTKTNGTAGSKVTSNGLIGLEAGVYAEIPAAKQIVIQPALLYDGKGGKYNIGGGYVQTQRFNYLMIPVDVLFKPEMPNGSGAWYLGAGPYLAYAISGKISDTQSSSDNIDPFKNYGNGAQLNRFDAGAHVQLGYEMATGLNIGLDASLGLMNIAAHGNLNNATHNTSFALTIGYTFLSGMNR